MRRCGSGTSYEGVHLVGLVVRLQKQRGGYGGEGKTSTGKRVNKRVKWQANVAQNNVRMGSRRRRTWLVGSSEARDGRVSL